MSMLMMLVEVTPRELEVLQRRPIEVTGLLSLEPPRPGLIGRLFGKKPVEVPQYTHHWGDLDERRTVDLESAWDVVHTLLVQGGGDVGEGLPEGFIWHGGQEIGDIDVGYGPARAVGPEEAKHILESLQPVDDAWVKDHWDLQLLKRVEPYPPIWDDLKADEEHELLADTQQTVSEAKAFLENVVDAGNGFVLWAS